MERRRVRGRVWSGSLWDAVYRYRSVHIFSSAVAGTWYGCRDLYCWPGDCGGLRRDCWAFNSSVRNLPVLVPYYTGRLKLSLVHLRWLQSQGIVILRDSFFFLQPSPLPLLPFIFSFGDTLSSLVQGVGQPPCLFVQLTVELFTLFCFSPSPSFSHSFLAILYLRYHTFNGSALYYYYSTG
ncbi:unnamed protein product, partial [Tuber aestivum]